MAVEESLANANVTPTAIPASADTGRARFAVMVVVAHALKHCLTSGLSSVLMPEIKAGLSLSDTQVGSLGSVQQFSGWFATMGAGYLGDRFNRKTGLMLAISLAVTGSALLTIGFARSYPMLIFAMLFMGFGPSMFHPPAVGALSRRFSDRRAFAISLHGTGGSIGEAAGPLVAAGLLAFLFWRDVLKVEFLPAIFAAFILLSFLKGPADAETNDGGSFRAYLRSFTGLLRQRALVLILLVTAFRSVGQATTSIFLPLYLRDDLGYSSALAGAYISLSQLAGIGSQPVMGMLTDRFGHKSVIIPALVLFSIILAVIPLAQGKVEMALIVFALGIFSFSMQSVLTSAAVELAGHEVHSTVVSLIYASSFIGSLAPTLAGRLSDSYGRPSTFYFSASLAVLATVVLILTRLPKRAHAA